jgi:ribosomal protein L37AE/L43A
MKKNFIKKIENFKCENCGERVIGDGYTDHCPRCLWGRHMDEEVPGDRASGCKGLMKPEYAEYVSGQRKIHYKCLSCGHKFVVREGKNDDCGKITEIMR